jgi:hypothetical protein
MASKFRPIPLPLLLVGVAAIAACLGYAFGSRWVRPSPCFHATANDPVVDRALDLYGHKKVSRSALRKSLDINVVYLADMTCVGLTDLPGTADGGTDTWCFDKSGQRVVLPMTRLTPGRRT